MHPLPFNSCAVFFSIREVTGVSIPSEVCEVVVPRVPVIVASFSTEGAWPYECFQNESMY